MGMGRTISTSRESDLAGWILQVEGRLFRIEQWTCTLALATMVVTIFLTIIRNLNLPWPNFGEWLLVSVIPLTFVGAAMCNLPGESHIC